MATAAGGHGIVLRVDALAVAVVRLSLVSDARRSRVLKEPGNGEVR